MAATFDKQGKGWNRRSLSEMEPVQREKEKLKKKNAHRAENLR